MAQIDSIYDFSDKALVELKAWLEPWFLTRCPCAAALSGERFSDGILRIGATRSLLGYWRLGEAASPFLDTNPYLSACNQTQQVTGTALTADVTGALSGGQDDGAVQFNSPGSGGDYLKSGCGTRFDLNASNFSFAAWIKPTVSASSFTGGIGGALTGGAITIEGWGFTLGWPTGTLTFLRSQDGGSSQTTTTTGVTSGAWHFIVGTYSTSAGMALYVDGVLVDTDSATFNTPTPHTGVFIGATDDVLGTRNYFYGVIDEVSVWGDTLTSSEIAELYADA